MEKSPPKDQFHFFVLIVQLQEYINKPHEMLLWTTNTDGLILHNTILQDDGEFHKVYIPSSNLLTRKTRSGQCFKSKMVVDGRSEFQSYASITPLQKGQVLLHSLVSMYINLIPVSGFEQTIKNMTNQTLWLLLD